MGRRVGAFSTAILFGFMEQTAMALPNIRVHGHRRDCVGGTVLGVSVVRDAVLAVLDWIGLPGSSLPPWQQFSLDQHIGLVWCAGLSLVVSTGKESCFPNHLNRSSPLPMTGVVFVPSFWHNERGTRAVHPKAFS